MILLEDVVKQERRILVDTSILPFHLDDYRTPVEKLLEEIKRLKYIGRCFANSNAFIIPEVSEEIREFKSSTRGDIHHVKKIINSGNYKRCIKELYHLLRVKEQMIDRLLKNLAVLDLSSMPDYESLKAVMYSLQDKFKVKKEDSNPRRSDEATIAAALFLSAFGSGRTVILSRDRDFPRLLSCAIHNIHNFDGLGEKLLESLGKEDNGIIIYTPIKGESYILRYNSARTPE